MNRYCRTQRYVQLIMTFTAGLLLVAIPAFAQTNTGNIYGRVTDQTGTPLPGVTVTAASGGMRNTFVTERDGSYRFLRLPPGRYRVTAELAGLATVTRSVEVNIGSNAEIPLRLAPQVSEILTVTAETPLIDTRDSGTSQTITQEEIEQLPTARDPWVMLQMMPGVLVDRVNVGGNKSGQQSYFVSKGAERHQTTWNIDGVNVTEMDETGTTTFYYDFGSLQEFQVVTATSDPSIRTPGAQVNMVTKRGTNDVSGSARAVWADEEFQARATMPDTVREGNRVDNVTELGADVGAPIIRDRLWFYGAYGQNTIANITSSWLFPQRTELTNWTAKLNAQPLENNNASFYYMWSDKTVNARGLGTTRPPETARRQSGPGWIAKLEDTHNFGNNFVLTAMAARVDSGYKQEPRGGMDVEPFWVGSNGLDGFNRGWHRSYRMAEQMLEQNNFRADASTFFQTGDISHELKLGAGYREQETEWWEIWPGNMSWGEFYITRRGVRWQLAGLSRPAHPLYMGEYTDFYAGDTMTFGNLTLIAGARYDRQQAYNLPSEVPANPVIPDILMATRYEGDERKLTWESISPRLGMTYALGSERRTVVRASYNRYADQLGSSEAGTNNPFYDDQILYYYWEDLNGDRRVQREEIDFESGIYHAVELDPNNLSAGAPSPGRLDYDNHRPTTTDELIIGAEHEIVPGWAVGVAYTYRLRDNFIWNQYEKTRGAGDFYTMNDYELAGTASAIMPDGERISSPYYRLKSGIPRPTYYVTRNRPDYEQEYHGLEFTAQRRMSNRWMMRGQLTIADWRQKVGPGGIQDPSPLLRGDGCYTCNDSAVASSGGSDGYINANWAYSLSALYQAPWDINLGAVVTGRQGYINGYHIYPDRRVDGIWKRLVINEFDDYRFEDLFQLDLRVGKEFRMARGIGLELAVDLFNATNERAILWRGYEIIPEYDDDDNLIRTPETSIQEMQGPRLFRFSGRLRF